MPSQVPFFILFDIKGSEDEMRSFLLGVLVGMILAFVFIYVGGGKLLKEVGSKAVQLGEQLEGYERAVKKTLPLPKR